LVRAKISALIASGMIRPFGWKTPTL